MKNIFPIRAFKDNYIWTFFDEGSKQAWVVDPGDASPVIDTFKDRQLTLAGILLTHHHTDHSGGISELINYAGKIPVYAGQHSPIKLVTNRVKEGDEIHCGLIHFKTLEIPGHTLDHTAYFGNHLLFCGDTLFSAGCGRVFEGTPPQMYDSLNKLKSLPDDTEIYCGHEYTLQNLQFAQQVEPYNVFIKRKIEAVTAILQNNGCTLPSSLREEKMINPFLRYDQADVIQATERFAKKNLKTPAEVFTYLREWKNDFKN